MEYANAFHKKVDCLTLYIYDNEGNYVDTRVVTGPELQDENYRMKLELCRGRLPIRCIRGISLREKFLFHDPNTRNGEQI